MARYSVFTGEYSCTDAVFICDLMLAFDGKTLYLWYRDFVAMPLFEDMAPWNIVFVGGSLAYIDQVRMLKDPSVIASSRPKETRY